MVAARERLNELKSSRYAPNTISGYACDWKAFEQWCEHAGKSSLPADPETVALYLSHLVPKFKVSTMSRRLAAISSKHGAAGFPAPVTPMVKHVLSSARRKTKHRVKRMAAISIDELAAVSGVLADDDSLRALRDRAAILLGFGCAFRRSDICALDLCDVVLRKDSIEVTVARGKTDQEGHGHVLVIPGAKRPALCPVKAVTAWIVERGKWSGPLFSKVTMNDLLTHRRMSGYEVWYALKKATEKAGLDASKFGAHSLRAGFVTASADAGADVFDIMTITGHKSVENLGMYVRRTKSRYPLAAAL
jgi:integrase